MDEVEFNDGSPSAATEAFESDCRFVAVSECDSHGLPPAFQSSFRCPRECPPERIDRPVRLSGRSGCPYIYEVLCLYHLPDFFLPAFFRPETRGAPFSFVRRL